MRTKILKRYIRNKMIQRNARTTAPLSNGSNASPKILNVSEPNTRRKLCRSKCLENMSQAIRGNRIHANDDQRHRQFSLTQNVHKNVGHGHEEEAPAAAKKNPARGPNTLHHGTHTQSSQCSSRLRVRPRPRQPATAPSPMEAITSQDVPGEQSENHRSDQRNKIKQRQTLVRYVRDSPAETNSRTRSQMRRRGCC